MRSLWLISAFLGLGWYGAVHIDGVAAMAGRVEAGVLAPALACLLAARLLMSLAGWRLLAANDADPGFWRAWRAYILSQLGRYIPGGFWQLLGRHALYRDLGIGGQTAARLILVETVLLLGVTALLGAGLLLRFAPDGVSWAERPLLAGLILTTLVLFTLVLWRWFDTWLTPRMVIVPVLLFLGAFCLFGLALLLLLGADLGSLPTTIQVYAAGFLTGSFAVFAPSGIGVREGVVLAALGNRTPAEAAFAAVILHRFLLIAVDLVLAAIAWLRPG